MSLPHDPDRAERHDPADEVVLRMRSHADVIAVAAALTGFHPTNSLAVIALCDNQARLVVRADLPGVDATRETRIAAAGHVLRHAVRHGATSVALLGYGPQATVDPVMGEAFRLIDGTIELVDAVRVTDGRYFGYLCGDTDCNPPEGVPFDTSSTTVMAQFVMAGVAVLPDRAALADSIAPLAGPQLHAMRTAVNAASRALVDRVNRDGVSAAARAESDRVSRAMARYRAGKSIDDEEMARLLVGLVNQEVSATAWKATDDQLWVEDLWRDATRRATPGLVAAPASLLAFIAWRRGHGALARIAVDRALSCNPEHRIAVLMRQVLDENLPPSSFPGWGALGDDDSA